MIIFKLINFRKVLIFCLYWLKLAIRIANISNLIDNDDEIVTDRHTAIHKLSSSCSS